MITKEDIKLLCNYFNNIEVPEELSKLVTKINLFNEIQNCNDKLDELMKDGK